MNESYLVSQIIKAIYDNVTPMVFRVNTGTVKTDKGKWFKTGTPKGYSDISGNLPSGQAFYIEVKTATKPTADQVAFIEKAKQNGALAGIAHSIPEAYQIIGYTPKEVLINEQ